MVRHKEPIQPYAIKDSLPKKKSSKVQKIMEFSIKLTLKTLCVLSVKHHRPENMTDNPKGIIDNMKTMNSVQHINVFTVN